MNYTIANWYKSKIESLTWIDVLQGLVRTVTVEKPIGNKGEVAISRFPVACDADGVNCDRPETQKALAPDKSKRSVIYFEDNGIGYENRGGKGIYTSHIRLVCWLNGNRLTFAGCDPSPLAIAQIFDEIPGGFENYDGLSAIRNVSRSIPRSDAGLFAGYTFDMSKQFMFFPYHAFAIDLMTEFQVNPGCAGSLTNATPCA